MDAGTAIRFLVAGRRDRFGAFWTFEGGNTHPLAAKFKADRLPKHRPGADPRRQRTEPHPGGS